MRLVNKINFNTYETDLKFHQIKFTKLLKYLKKINQKAFIPLINLNIYTNHQEIIKQINTKIAIKIYDQR